MGNARTCCRYRDSLSSAATVAMAKGMAGFPYILCTGHHLLADLAGGPSPSLPVSNVCACDPLNRSCIAPPPSRKIGNERNDPRIIAYLQGTAATFLNRRARLACADST